MSIQLNKFLHSRWAADTALNALLDSAKLMTGVYVAATDPVFPYATLETGGTDENSYTNDGNMIDERTATFTVHHGKSNHDEGEAIVNAIRNAYNNSDFDIGGGAKVIVMRRSADGQSQDEDGNWQFVEEFICRVHTISGSGA